MFYSEVAIIEVIDRLGPFEGSISYYDKNWNELDEVTKGKYGRSSQKPPPYCLDQMIMQAQTLSKAYEIFVRIDFYATDKGAVFGEFTATPGSANYFTPKADKMFSLYWDTYNTGMI